MSVSDIGLLFMLLMDALSLAAMVPLIRPAQSLSWAMLDGRSSNLPFRIHCRRVSAQTWHHDVHFDGHMSGTCHDAEH